VPHPEADGDDFDTAVSQAVAAYERRDLEAALSHFIHAYTLQEDPALLFNIGLIADQVGQFDTATDYLGRYVRSPGADLDARDEALRRLEQIRKLQALDTPQQSAPQRPPQEDEVSLIDLRPSPPPEELPPAPLAPAPPAPERPLWAPLAVLGGGALILGGGSLMAVLASQQHDAFRDANTLAKRREAADLGANYALAADLLFVSGGLVTAGGIAYLVYTLVATSDDSLGLAPTLAPGRLGLTLSF